jgi:hypothetical protein
MGLLVIFKPPTLGGPPFLLSKSSQLGTHGTKPRHPVHPTKILEFYF